MKLGKTRRVAHGSLRDHPCWFLRVIVLDMLSRELIDAPIVKQAWVVFIGFPCVFTCRTGEEVGLLSMKKKKGKKKKEEARSQEAYMVGLIGEAAGRTMHFKTNGVRFCA